MPQIKRTNHKKDMKVHEYQAKLLFKDYGLPVVDQNILCRTVEEAVEAAELERSINAFLHTLSEQECNVFLRRYWFVEEYAEIAGRYGMNLNTVKTSLFRTRKKLQKYLEQQGIVL